MAWEPKEFWAETLRTVVLGVVGAIASILYIERSQEQWRLLTETSMKVVDDFVTSGYDYTAKIYDGCKRNPDPETIKALEKDITDRYRTDLERLRVYFGRNQSVVSRAAKVDALYAQMGKLCVHSKTDYWIWGPVREQLKIANRCLAQAALKTSKVTETLNLECGP